MWSKDAVRRGMELCRSGPISLNSLSLLVEPHVKYILLHSIALKLLSTRNWREIKLSCRLFQRATLVTLAGMNGLTSLTLTGAWGPFDNWTEAARSSRMMGVTNVVLSLNAYHDDDGSTKLVETIALACPNLRRIEILFNNSKGILGQ
jgi:hypothetical protein